MKKKQMVVMVVRVIFMKGLGGKEEGKEKRRRGKERRGEGRREE